MDSIKLSDRYTLIAVEVEINPEVPPVLIEGEDDIHRFYYWKGDKIITEEFGKGEYTLLGTATDFLNSPDCEQRCREWVGVISFDGSFISSVVGFKDYTENETIFQSAKQSFISALTKMGVKPESYRKTFLIIKTT